MTSEERAILARNIEAARRALGMSQADLATAAGLRQATVSDIERGASNPSLDTLLRIAKALGTTLHALTDGGA